MVVLGSDTAEQLFSGRNPVGQTVTYNGSTLQVVGVLAALSSSDNASSNDVAIVPFTTYSQRLVGGTNRDSVSSIYLKATSNDTLSAAYQEAQTLLVNLHGSSSTSNADFSIATQESILSAATTVDKTMSVMLAGIAIISLLVGGIGVMNIMLVSVTERIREIGLRKALGARPRLIRRQFLVEASALGLAGGALGVAIGVRGRGSRTEVHRHQIHPLRQHVCHGDRHRRRHRRRLRRVPREPRRPTRPDRRPAKRVTMPLDSHLSLPERTDRTHTRRRRARRLAIGSGGRRPRRRSRRGVRQLVVIRPLPDRPRQLHAKLQQTLNGVGTIEPVAQATVAFPASGTVASVAVKPGDNVTAGTELASLDQASLEQAVTQAQSNLDQAELTLERAQNGQAVTNASGATSGATAQPIRTALTATTPRPTLSSSPRRTRTRTSPPRNRPSSTPRNKSTKTSPPPTRPTPLRNRSAARSPALTAARQQPVPTRRHRRPPRRPHRRLRTRATTTSPPVRTHSMTCSKHNTKSPPRKTHWPRPCPELDALLAQRAAEPALERRRHDDKPEYEQQPEGVNVRTDQRPADQRRTDQRQADRRAPERHHAFGR